MGRAEISESETGGIDVAERMGMEEYLFSSSPGIFQMLLSTASRIVLFKDLDLWEYVNRIFSE